MPNLLSEQKESHVSMCQGLQESLETDPEFFSKVITGDELWVYEYHQKAKQDLSQWTSSSSPFPQKLRQICWNVKSTLVVFSIFARLCICFEKANPKLTVHTDTWHLQENVQCKVESGIYGISTMTMHLLRLLCLSGESLAKIKCQCTSYLLPRFSTMRLPSYLRTRVSIKRKGL